MRRGGSLLQTTSTEEPEEVLDAESQILERAVRVIQDFCAKYKAGEIEERNEPQREARDFCD